MPYCLFHVILLSMLCCLLSGPAWGAAAKGGTLDELERGAGVKLHYSRHERTGAVRSLWTEPGQAIPQHFLGPEKPEQEASARGPETAATAFLDRYGMHFGVKDAERELKVKRTSTADRGRAFIRFQQLHQGLPVIGGEMVVQLDAANGVMSAHGKTSPDAALDTAPLVSAAEAKETALRTIAPLYNVDTAMLVAGEPELSVYDPALLNHREGFGRVLVWRLEVKGEELSQINEFVLIDAKNGNVALHFNQIDYAKSRTIYDNNNNSAFGLPGFGPVRTEGSPASGNADVDSAYTYLGDTYDFYYGSFGRDSVNGAGLGLVGTVRYCESGEPCPYPNAFWDGTQMVFGQGFAAADDVVAHELTHGVTQYTSGLFYYMQPGAINESLSDIFGEFVDLTNGKGNDGTAVRWKMGEDLPGGAIRDMKDPTVMGDPDRMTSINYFCGNSDNGGVHANSSVSNKAAYLMTDGGAFNGKNVIGLGVTKAAKIFYEAQVHLLISASDFADLYDDLILACNNLTGTAGITAADCQQVQNAVDAVEMNRQPTFCSAPEAPLCPAGTTPVNVFFDNFEAGAGNWTSAAIVGANAWAPIATGYAASGDYALYGQDLDTISDSYVRTVNAIAIPANAYLHFKHFYDFEYGMTSPAPPLSYFDGGVLEYSNNGTTWLDAGTGGLIINNGYTQAITSLYDNPLKPRSAFAGTSNGYISSRLNLSSLSGQNVRFRFRIGSDSSTGAMGWGIDDFRVYTCSDTVAPTVAATTPADGAIAIPVNSKVTATFSEAMNAGTVGNATFTLVNRNTGSAVAGAVAYNPATFAATFTPSASLAADTPYLATITTGVSDTTGHALALAKTWRFRTSAATDAGAPTITARSPAVSATGVPLTAPVIACFSETMDPATITNATFTLNNAVTGAVSYNGTTNCAVYTPAANLTPSTTYTATITTGVKDAAGNAFAGTSWSFTTTATGAPTEIVINGGFENNGGWYGYSSTGAALLASGAGHNSSVFGYLGKADNAFEYIFQPVTIPANATAANAQFWYKISTNESPNTTPFDFLYALVMDADGLVLENIATRSNVNASSSWAQIAPYDLKKYKGRRVYLYFYAVNDSSLPTTFMIDDVSVMVTTPPADVAAPTVVATGPAAAATGVPTAGRIGATFSEAMDAATITTGTFTLNNGATGAVSYDAATCTATLTPSASLTPNTAYTSTISTGVKDLAGNALALKNWSFTTATLTQTLSVTIAGTGAGTVNSSPAGIACGPGAAGTCAAPFYYDTVATLMAAPSAGSIFAGWTGACAGSGDCGATMDFNKGATGTFNYFPAHIYGAVPGNYSSLQAAYNAAAANDLIQAQAATLSESPLLNRPSIAVTIRGGYDNNFNAVTGTTTVQGTLTIQQGTVTIDNVTVR